MNFAQGTLVVPDWDERYRGGEHTTAEPSALLRTAIAGRTPGRALDLACGAGRNALYLAESGWKVTAVDGSRVAIEMLTARALERGVTVEALVADLEAAEFQIEPDAYDLICDFQYLQRDLLPAIRAGVKPGGIVVAEIHLNDGKPNVNPTNPRFLLERSELRKIFSDWKIEHYEERADEDGHHHDAAHLIARKPI
jgi:tellurite methyltransferase